MVTLSDFQANADSYFRQVLESGRPLLISDSDKGVAVLPDAEAYAELSERTELLHDILNANDELDAGLGISHEAALTSVLTRLAER